MRLSVTYAAWSTVGLLLAQPGFAQLAEFGKDITISAPVDADLYISGGTVTINAPVHGDLVVAGGTVRINDSVTSDLIVAGGTVTLHSHVGDDIRCGGGEVYLKSSVGGDLLIGGGKIFIEKNARIAGGLLVAGGDIKMDGLINGDARVISGSYYQTGVINGNFSAKASLLSMNGTVKGTAELAAGKLLLGRDAAFYNGVRYWSETENPGFERAMKNGVAIYDRSLKIRSGRWSYLGHTTLLGAVWYLGTAFVFILLLQFLFGSQFRQAADFGYNRTLRSLLYGILFFAGVPVGAILLMITIIGIPLGIIVLLAYVTLIGLATVIAALVISSWLNNRIGQTGWKFGRMVFLALAIFVLLKMITFIPFFGWLIMLTIASVSFGAILMNINFRRLRLS